MVPFGEAVVLTGIGIISILLERPIVPAAKKAAKHVHRIFVVFIVVRFRRKRLPSRIVSAEPTAQLRRPSRGHTPVPNIHKQTHKARD